MDPPKVDGSVLTRKGSKDTFVLLPSHPCLCFNHSRFDGVNPINQNLCSFIL